MAGPTGFAAGTLPATLREEKAWRPRTSWMSASRVARDEMWGSTALPLLTGRIDWLDRDPIPQV
jgi:hypothetical protein